MMDDHLFDLFQQEHPDEVQYILEHGVPESETFLSYLQTLVAKRFERSYNDQQQKDYDAAMELDLLLHTKTTLETKLQDVVLEMTKEDKRSLMLKPYNPKAFEVAVEKEAMVHLLTKLRNDFVPLKVYIESAQKILSYVNKS